MNLRQLQIFRAVIQYQSFSRAAEKLHIAQSAVSTAVQKLEHSLDVKLFNRGERRHPALTAEGQALNRHAEKILLQCSEASHELEELRGLQRGEVRLGCPAMLASYYFPDHFTGFLALYPGLTINVIDAGTQQIRQMIINGDLESGIVPMDDPDPSLTVRPLIQEEMLAYVSKDHPLAGNKSVSFTTFSRERLVIYREGYFLRNIIDNLFYRHESVPNIVFETNLIQLTKTLLRENLGVGVCLRCIADTDEELNAIPFRPAIPLHFGLAWRANSHLSKANKRFADFILRCS